MDRWCEGSLAKQIVRWCEGSLARQIVGETNCWRNGSLIADDDTFEDFGWRARAMDLYGELLGGKDKHVTEKLGTSERTNSKCSLFLFQHFMLRKEGADVASLRKEGAEVMVMVAKSDVGLAASLIAGRMSYRVSIPVILEELGFKKGGSTRDQTSKATASSSLPPPSPPPPPTPAPSPPLTLPSPSPPPPPLTRTPTPTSHGSPAEKRKPQPRRRGSRGERRQNRDGAWRVCSGRRVMRVEWGRRGRRSLDDEELPLREDMTPRPTGTARLQPVGIRLIRGLPHPHPHPLQTPTPPPPPPPFPAPPPPLAPLPQQQSFLL
ncbi:MAG: hypothetical protein NXY57DRAFT_1044158 [Lentinula lateritia]|nr:MAG: hypothetical protein NXY57DRAFT_1044158 [Lentinula lateritia]